MGEGAQQDAARDFLAACGVDAVLCETAQDRFAEAAVVARVPGALAPSPLSQRRPAEPEPPASVAPAQGERDPGEAAEAVVDAREVARSAATLAELHEAMRRFEGCPLKGLARTTCVGEGPSGAALMLVGEAPGREEDDAGRPFVGRSGQLLTKMLAAIGLPREAVYISNVIPWRPPANRTPSPAESATCEVFVRREIALVRPKVLVALGGAAARTLLEAQEGIMRQRGRWVSFDLGSGGGSGLIDAVATFHPAYLLRSPAEKGRAWSDLLAVKRRLG